jgi:ribosomal protein S18 acetylase RimI-like enzyme
MDMISVADKQDGSEIMAITARAGVFSQEEADCVAELWDEYFQKGAQASGYSFDVYREDGHIQGYACYGLRALTEGTYDLYWIAVDPSYRRNSVGRKLLEGVEEEIRQLGGRLLVVETSGVEKYTATRRFYLATGYTHEATLRDFYHDGDDLVIFTKHLK